MKKMNIKLMSLWVVVVLTAALAIGCTSNTSQPSPASSEEKSEVVEIKNIKGPELVEQNSGKEKDKVLIIDVRSPQEYKAGHIPNAININIEGFEDKISEIADLKEFPIIVYCNTGNKSGQVAEILVANGFKDVTNAEGVKQFEYDLVHYDDVRGAAFQKLINENQDIVIVDVRPEEQVKEEGMINGAINVPFDAVETNLDKLPKDKTIAVYCNTGTKSVEAAGKLEALGYEHVVNSIDGVKEYAFKLIK
ncbi:MAG: hypothetical protein K0R93_2592 [Anaerosolibacter sp.]|jgi:rhodanese-related sulfurtransferase|uniref:rhodanese-like domain-containing protein n=1 Tax=Anaerosolibacter sp. TaxID=1872527 RepID=UPI00262BB953|nr:rhodanese-like domain-containing protein [Anaerosolibacter sp.]MDF2547694.1 hypothetical protein [Anaerosolibacter sp.]